MGSILVNVPDFSAEELVFDEDETRLILKFFWPQFAGKINSMPIGRDMQRLAQSALVAAIDGSYAMGFIYDLARTVVRPHSGIRSLGKKLARRFVRRWWKHATRSDLENVRIFNSVRDKIAVALRDRLELVFNGVALKRGELQFYALAHAPICAWG